MSRPRTPYVIFSLRIRVVYKASGALSLSLSLSFFVGWKQIGLGNFSSQEAVLGRDCTDQSFVMGHLDLR